MSTNHEDRVNMVPLIDCMFFLILFFMIVTKFTPDEKAIASLLPSQGQGGTPITDIVVPPQQVFIAVHPDGLARGLQPSDYERQVDGQWRSGVFGKHATLRIGGSDGVVIAGDALSDPKATAELMSSDVEAIHHYVFRELAARESEAAKRDEQPQVVIACYSGLPFKDALVVYDAVRAYEASKDASIDANQDLALARQVSFAPPRVRNTNHELRDELYEIVNHL
jgi:hypothetical protein